jgi:EpsI family protein
MHVPPFRMDKLLIVIGTMAFTAAVYWPCTGALWAYWTDPSLDMQYGVLVLLLSLWLVFRARQALAEVPLRPSPWAFPAVIALSAGSLIFWRAGIQSLQLLLLPALVLSALLAALGPRAARVMVLPIGYLYFAMPGWGYLAPALQDLTARAVGVLLPLSGIPAHVTGQLVGLPGGGAFEITTACSGINFLVVGLAVAALIGELEGGSLRRRAALLLTMGVLAIAGNWARAALIVAIGYSTDMRHVWATRDHILFGWVIFAAVLLGFVWLAPRIAAPSASLTPTPGPSGAWPPRALVRTLASVAAALAVLPAAAYSAAARVPADAPPPPASAAPANPGWRRSARVTRGQWQPIFVGPHSEWHLRYEDATAERAIEVVAIGYSRQEQGRELVNYGNSLVGAGGLTVVGRGVETLDRQAYREWEVTDRLGRHSLIWSVYDIGGRTFVTPLYSQLWYGTHSFGRPPYSALFAFRAGCEPTCEAARGTLVAFLQTLGTDLFASLASAPVRGPV